MDSITKRKLSNPEVNVLIREVFGDGFELKKLQELTDGWFNATYMIILNTEKEVVLKVLPPTEIKTLQYEQDIMYTEVEILRWMKKTEIVPVPEVIFYDNSKKHLNCEYYFMEKLQGTPYNKLKDNLSEQEKAKIEIELGRYNRKINDITGSHFGYYSPKSKRYDKWSEAFISFINDILQDGMEYDIELPDEYEKIRELVMSKSKILDCVIKPCLVHWDIWDANIFVNIKAEITGIIDFERALWGDPLMEVYFGGLNHKSSFCKGYGREMEFSEEEKTRRLLYDLYVSLIMVIEYKYRGYTDQGHENSVNNALEKNLELLKEMN